MRVAARPTIECDPCILMEGGQKQQQKKGQNPALNSIKSLFDVIDLYFFFYIILRTKPFLLSIVNICIPSLVDGSTCIIARIKYDECSW